MDVLINKLLTSSGANYLLVLVVVIVVTAFARNLVYLSREMQAERDRQAEIRKDYDEAMTGWKEQQEISKHQQQLFDQAMELFRDMSKLIGTRSRPHD